MMRLKAAGACPAAGGAGREIRPHAWQLKDHADLRAYGPADLGVTVGLGRCRDCDAPLVALAPLGADDPGEAGMLVEVRGAEL